MPTTGLTWIRQRGQAATAGTEEQHMKIERAPSFGFSAMGELRASEAQSVQLSGERVSGGT
jgi:hypothetical protein